MTEIDFDCINSLACLLTVMDVKFVNDPMDILKDSIIVKI